jgi:predicted permease
MTQVWTRLYRLLLSLLPPRARGEDADEIASVLGEQLEGADSAGLRGRILWRAFARLPRVLVVEWIDDVWGERPRTGKPKGTGRSRMSRWTQRGRLGVRSLRRSPAFAWSSILLIGLGVGAVTSVFTVVDHVVFRPLPYPAEDRLVFMTNGSHSGPTLRGLDGIQSIDRWTAVYDRDANLEVPGGDPLRLRKAELTPSFFSMFGARPALGRLLVEADRDDPSLAVLTHEAWTAVWGSDPDVVGTSIRLDGELLEVVGVLDDHFVLPEGLVGKRLHVLHPMDWSDPSLEDPQSRQHAVVARLAEGATLGSANAELTRLAEELDVRYPGRLRTRDGNLQQFPFAPLGEYTVRRAARGLNLFLVGVGLLLLVACANVAHLFLARGIARAQEMAVRRALGAGTLALMAQLSVESALVGLGGAAVGSALAATALAAFEPWLTVSLPRGAAISLDLRVLGFAAALAVGTAFVFGLLPALRTIGRNVGESLRGTGRGVTQNRRIHLLRNGLVAGEVALSLILVTMSGLLLRSFLEMTAQDPGIRIEDTWVMPVDFPVQPASGQYARVMGEIRASILEVPGVEAVTFGMEGPFQWVGGSTCCWGTSVFIGAEDESTGPTQVHAVEASFLDTYGIELLAGRVWPRSETVPEPVPAVLADALATRLFGSAEAAVGQTIRMGGREDASARVVGVAADTRYYGLDQGVDEAVFLPVEALPFPLDIGTFGIFAPDAQPGLARELREAVWRVQPTLPLPEVVPLDTWLRESAARRRFAALLVVFFGSVALALAAGGLYGTLLYAVHQRRKELGIRLALGAGRNRIEQQVVRSGLLLAAVGASVGGVAALWLGGLLDRFVFGVGTQDPVSFVVAVALLMGTAGVASWIPARRASSTDPLQTLSAE